jgi:hypothetical protein
MSFSDLLLAVRRVLGPMLRLALGVTVIDLGTSVAVPQLESLATARRAGPPQSLVLHVVGDDKGVVRVSQGLVLEAAS